MKTWMISILVLLALNINVNAQSSAAVVSVDKTCYRKGETIQVTFSNVVGENVWIGLLKQQETSTTTTKSVDNQLIDYVFTCGDKVMCTGDAWPTQGTVSFSTNDLNDDEYTIMVSDSRPDTMSQATSSIFRIDFTCIDLPNGDEIVASSMWSLPKPTDQRGPCPFINTLANHGIINRNGTYIDLFDMAARLEAVYNVAEEFLHHGPVQLAIDCNQTYVDDDGIIRIDLERLFDDRCEEHEASMVRTDSFYGFERSKLVDDILLNSLMRKNPTSMVLTRKDVMEFQSDRIMDSRIINPETIFRPFDIENMGAQGIFLFLLSTDPTLETVDKSRLYFFLLLEKLPDDFVPGALRDTPFNFLDPTDFTQSRFVESMTNVESMMHISLDGNRVPIGGGSVRPSH